jgi:hypothetical protein
MIDVEVMKVEKMIASNLGMVDSRVKILQNQVKKLKS